MAMGKSIIALATRCVRPLVIDPVWRRVTRRPHVAQVVRVRVELVEEYGRMERTVPFLMYLARCWRHSRPLVGGWIRRLRAIGQIQKTQLGATINLIWA